MSKKRPAARAAPRSRPTHDALPLRTVTATTGLSPDLIRAWERRYGVVAPIRGPRGARLYSAADVAHLRLLAQVVASGRVIGDVAGLSAAQLAQLIRPVAEPPAQGEADALTAPILAAVARLDAPATSRLLGDALLALGPDRFADRCACPLLREVGVRWKGGRLCVAEEHLLSAALRTILCGLIQQRSASSRPVILLAAPTGERHELGMLLFALRALDHSLGTLYLGTDLPAAEIAAAATRAHVRVVGLGLTNPAGRTAFARAVAWLQHTLPPSTEIWLGGAAARQVGAAIPRFRGAVLDDRTEIDSHLARLRAAHAWRT